MINQGFPNIAGQEVFLDLETTGLRWWADDIFGVALRVGNISHYWDIREKPNVLNFLRGELPKTARVVNHNTKFDYHFLREAGVKMDQVPVVCTMVLSALINEHEFDYGLDALAATYLNRRKDTDVIAAGRELLGQKLSASKIKGELHRLPSGVVGAYATIDVELAELLYRDYCLPEITKQGLSNIVDLETRLLPVLARMEERGVRVDVAGAEQAAEVLTRRINEAQSNLNKLAGGELNTNSPKQIIALFTPENLAAPGERPRWIVRVGGQAISIPATEGGAPSVGAETLRRMPGDAPRDILRLRKLLKTRDTFILGHILGHHVDGIVHTNFNQTKGDNEMGTGTGRLSANAPALQQISKRDPDLASIVRAMFLPYEKQEWVSADWDQKEFRWFAHYAQNPAILKMYADDPDTDYHKAVAGLTGLPRSATPGIKGNAKQINLGLVFGMGMGRLAQEMGLPYEEATRQGKVFLVPGPEAEEVFAKYHKAVPGVKDLLDQAASVARSRGYVVTAGGRHIRFPRGQFVHKAAGLIFQGTAADCMKYKLIEHDKEWGPDSDVHMLLSVHDEVDFSVPPGDTKVHARIKEINESFDGSTCPIKCRVPIRCSVTAGETWWHASK
jgi:DNA polymerase-1